MSTNLDRSLDEILAGRKSGRGRRGVSGPVGGIKKRPQRAAAAKAMVAVTQTQPRSVKAAAPASTSTGDASKIIVSNLVGWLFQLLLSSPVLTLSVALGCQGTNDQGMLPVRMKIVHGLYMESLDLGFIP